MQLCCIVVYFSAAYVHNYVTTADFAKTVFPREVE